MFQELPSSALACVEIKRAAEPGVVPIQPPSVLAGELEGAAARLEWDRMP